MKLSLLILLALLLAACEGISQTGVRTTSHQDMGGGELNVRINKANGSVLELSSSPVEEVYTIDTHGNNYAYIDGSKKLHEVIYKKIPDISVRVWEATLAGESTGMIYIIVGYPSMADMERIGKIIEEDEEIQSLFAEREKVGATIVSCNLSVDVTP